MAGSRLLYYHPYLISHLPRHDLSPHHWCGGRTFLLLRLQISGQKSPAVLLGTCSCRHVWLQLDLPLGQLGIKTQKKLSRRAFLGLETSVEFSAKVFKSWFTKKGKHISLVSFNTWLVKWVDAVKVT